MNLERIIEIVEIGQSKSLIQRVNSPITELIKTDALIEELNEQLQLCNIVELREQLLAWEKWKVEKGNYPEYRTKEQMMDDYLSQ